MIEPANLDCWIGVSELISNLITAAAIIVGGVWAYWRFARERTRWPRAQIEVKFAQRLVGKKNLLSVKVLVKNEGRGLMELTELRLDLHRVLPLDEQMRDRVERGAALAKDSVEADWPLLQQLVHRWTDSKTELEPGESDEFGFDFFVDAEVEAVFLYLYLQNVAKKGGNRELGWTVTRLHDIEVEAPSGPLDPPPTKDEK